MRKRKIFITISVILLAIIVYLGLPISYSFYMAIVEPMGSMRIEDEFRKLSSDVLIKKLHPMHPFAMTPAYAMQILAERRETKAVPELIKFVKSWHPDNRYQAIRALGNIGDERAIEPLLEIVKKGDVKNNPNYHESLFSLCQIGYEPVHPIVLEMLKRPDGARNGSTKMMEYIGTKEDIPILEAMLSNIQGTDVNARLDRSGIKKAIETIKQREGIQ